MEEIIRRIAESLNVSAVQVENTLRLLEEGNTVPFIARYRKEMTQNLDEEQIFFISKEHEYQNNLKKRKEDVLRLIEAQGKCTREIISAVNACQKLSQVDDIYRPYQQKKKTRAADAINKGLEKLADYLMSCPKTGSIEKEAEKYLNEQVLSIEEALQGARDIVAERVSDNAKLRWKIKESIENYGRIVTKEKKKHEDTDQVYKMYYDRTERISMIQPHRIMAIERAESEKVITVTLEYDQGWLINYAVRGITRNRMTVAQTQIEEAVKDGMKRLAFPSVEREVRSELKEKAQKQSIEIFSLNLEKLLLQPPMAGKTILGFDPAFRTGCKLAIIDDTGKLLNISVIYPHEPVNKKKEAEKILCDLYKEYHYEIIAIGNGTASRESESFVADVIQRNHLNVQYTLVSEAGASVYSASELARAEFPDLTVEKRSAVSIGRRTLDPLSELIKIDPKSIGVGQYQHDLPQKQLQERLDFAIEKSVNRVGVDVNTASKELLMHVSGLNKSIAEEIINWRNLNGRFDNRNQLKTVKKLGPKAFEQSSGFLRVRFGSEELDGTSIHPESYKKAKALLQLCGNYPLGSKELSEALSYMNIYEVSQKLQIDEYTLTDMIEALKAPLRDYRERYDGPLLRSDVLELEHLHEGDMLEGVVRNVVDFGAFVDIGLHDDGLIHVSKLTKEKITHPSEIVSVGDLLKVKVHKIDHQRKRVQLTLID
ncbi:MAG: RNA-binding transcriptional accessory protein [Erysipelotrichaceae bacterium]|nr:RNA-binding transcriptional accessory protein [Erysipelotrichaceae bacterium]